MQPMEPTVPVTKGISLMFVRRVIRGKRNSSIRSPKLAKTVLAARAPGDS